MLSRLYTVLGCAVLLFPVAAPAQVKLGIINLEKAVVGTAEIKKASADLEAKYKPRQRQMEALQKELQDLQQQLTTMAGKLTAQAESDMTAEGQRKQRELQRLNEDLQADVDRERNDILAKTGGRMQEVVKKLADEKGLDAVINANSMVFFKDALDITKEATAAYDKAYPVK